MMYGTVLKWVMGKLFSNPNHNGPRERNLVNWNSKALNDILWSNSCKISQNFYLLYCESGMRLDKLCMREGIDIVKQTKIQNLNIAFETLRMKESKTSDDFHFKLSDIVNSSFNFGESVLENKVIKKILRSLPERSHANVVAIEEHTDLNTLVLRNRLEICKLLS